MPKGVKQPAEERFWLYVMPIPWSGCWIWMGGLTNGYGHFHPEAGRDARAHIFPMKCTTAPCQTASS